jgi:hypothetical protein
MLLLQYEPFQLVLGFLSWFIYGGLTGGDELLSCYFLQYPLKFCFFKAKMKPGGRMSTWRGKFVIGLTGNIAMGKSVVRKMLAHLGVYGIETNAQGHRAIAKDAPGYQKVMDT